MQDKTKIEVFTGSCRLCEGAVRLVNEVVDPERAEVTVRSIDGPEAQAYGLTAVPSIVRDGKLVFARLPSREEAEGALR